MVRLKTCGSAATPFHFVLLHILSFLGGSTPLKWPFGRDLNIRQFWSVGLAFFVEFSRVGVVVLANHLTTLS